MKQPLNIVMIGAGSVASQILNSFEDKKGIHILQVVNRRKTAEAKLVAKKSNCELVTDYKKINKTADVYFICVTDDAITDVAKQLIPLSLQGIIVHTSGSVDSTILSKTSTNFGVYYPLQTFSKNVTINWKTTPILIEANTKKNTLLIKSMALMVSGVVKNINSATRLQFHLAAVFGCNFTNALYEVAFSIISKKLSKKDTKLLMPLLTQSFEKLNVMSPKDAQTGPAKRQDKKVMQTHLHLLNNELPLKKIYKQLSTLIDTQQNE